MDLISVHVPKTAGTAFAKVLKLNYGQKGVITDHDWQEKIVIGPETRVIHGHFKATHYFEKYPETRQITWMRHPVSWMISLYYFWKHSASVPGNGLHRELLARNLSLPEFIEHPQARNIVSAQFIDRDPREFFFVGVNEHFREDLLDLGQMLGWSVCQAPFDNKNPQPGYRELVQSHLNDAGLVRQIEALNEADVELYRRVLALRGRRRSKFRKIIRSTGLPRGFGKCCSLLSRAAGQRRAA